MPTTALTDTPAFACAVDALAARTKDLWGSRENAAQYARQELTSLLTLVGEDVPSQYTLTLAAADTTVTHDDTNPFGTYGWASPATGQVIRDAHRAGMPADFPARMAERGPKWLAGCVRRWVDGLTDAEMGRLDGIGMAGSPAQAMAFVGCAGDAIDAWRQAAEQDAAFNTYLGRYLQTRGVGQYIRAGVPLEDVRLCFTLDVEPGLALRGLKRPDGTTEHGPDAIRELLAYAQAAKASTDEAYEGIAAGLPASALKEYGPAISVGEIRQFQDAYVPGKVARSLRAKDRSLTVATIRDLYDVGIATGAAFTAWRKAVTRTVRDGMYRPARDTVDLDAVMTLACAGVPVTVVENLGKAKVPFDSMVDLYRAGIEDLGPWFAHLERRTQGLMDDRDLTGVYRALAAFAAAGGTVEQFARAQRAGVPIRLLPHHVHSTRRALWAAGKANREAVMADERRRFTQWGAGYAPQPSPWPVSAPADL